MKKKKIVLALLASLCVAASATAFAACGNSTDNSDVKDPALYAAYQTYAADKTDPVPYEEWVESILNQLKDGGIQGPKGERGDDGVGIKDINIIEKNGQLYFQFTMTDDSVVEVLVNN